MIFGDKKTFAVEIDWIDESVDHWLFGHICYWIRGEQVGDFEETATLTDALVDLKYRVGDCGNRHGGGLCDLGPDDLFGVLDRALFEWSDDVNDSNFTLPDVPARFDISFQMDVFYDWKIYLIECERYARAVYKHCDDDKIRCADIPVGTYEFAIKEANIYLMQRVGKIDEKMALEWRKGLESSPDAT